MTTVPVNKEILIWALDRAGFSVEDLQSKFSKIKEWFSGQGEPTLRQVESLAKITATPLGFFFLDNPPEEILPIPYYRTLEDDEVSKPSPDLLDTIHIMQQRQSWMRDYLIDQGNEPLSFVRSVQQDEQPATIAKKIRQAFELDEDWASLFPTWTDAMKALRLRMEDAGIIISVNGIVGNNTHRKLEPSEFRGFVLVDDYAPLVFVNGADSKAAQMFTLAHEIAHIFIGSSAAFDLRQMAPANDRVEKRCNSVAAEFLVPENMLRKIWPILKEEPEPFHEVARRCKVSALVVARRLLDLHFINKNDFLEFYSLYCRDERRAAARKTDGGDFYANQNLRVGQHFANAVFRAVKEGKLLYTNAYKLTGLYGKSFSQYASHIGMGGV